ncbi:hypothetical protein [Nitrosopumilus adriaticus]|uniref:AbrB family transcriptional regulator n=1 Tax=Nitrosopumilus adriaticus TaxID=1580092 RepID=A0A0D5C2H5_9ARCH|nr:hypothetical protein [Nitrosopumilus adriaticus]AJW70607.1 hypothetical protein NADRNF5_0913 [Nitrosopumilus adriaticus]
MTVKISPTQIKQSTYLLIPKDIADMIDVDKNTKFSLKLKPNGKHHVLEYEIQ